VNKILITGASGLVGSRIAKQAKGYIHESMICCPDSKVYDLTIEEHVKELFKRYHLPESPIDTIVHCAARVGGIGRNLNSPYRQYTSNILMNTNIIEQAALHGVKNLIAFSSVCAFPAKAEVIKEDVLHDGEPYPAHRSYAYSKRMVDIQIEALMKEYPQFNYNYCSVIPGNIFGPDDNFDLENGHVVPSLIRKAHRAAELGQPLVVWGTGEAIREFIYSEDIAKACIRLLLKDTMPQRILVSGKAFKIKEIAEIIAEFFGIKLEFDSSKPDGQMVRITDKEVFNRTLAGFEYTDIKESLQSTIRWYCDNFPRVRGI
jgi:GDP-L-fucose synthase